MPRTPKQSVAWLRKLVKSRTTEFDQRCKELSRKASGIDSDGTPTARAAWGKTKHRGAGPASKAPEGAKIWWTSGSAGHVVTANGKGGGIGNYYKDGGRVRELSMKTWNASMGGPPVGWSYDIDGELAVPLPKARAKVRIDVEPHPHPPAMKAPAKAAPKPLVDVNSLAALITTPAEARADEAVDFPEPVTGVLGHLKQLLATPREPLGNRASIVALVGLVVGLLAVVGVRVTPVLSDQLVDVLVIAVPTLAPLVLAWWARRHVTPVADPRAEDGTPLVRLLRRDPS